MSLIKLPPEYKERPMAPELDLVSRVHGRYKGTGQVMPLPQREMYQNITKAMVTWATQQRGYPKRIIRPTVCDVGCGVGIGANIMSQEASFTWGIDSNAESIEYANQMFARLPNNLYYTPQLTFDRVDATDAPREMQKFDFVTCIEVIEHIPSNQVDSLIKFLNRLMNDSTVLFISSPNRNSPKIQKDTPFNEHHCYEATAGEMYEYLTQKYKHVVIFNTKLQPQELSTEDTPLLFKCEKPI